MDLSKGQSNTKIELHVEHMDNVVETGCGYQVSRNSPAMDRSGPFSLKLNSVVWKSTTNLSDNADSLRYILSGEKNRQGSSNFGNRQDVLKSKAITSNVDQCPFSFESVIYSTQKKAEHSPSHIESDYKHIKAKHTTRSLSADRFRESSESPPPRSNGCPVTAVRALREKLNNRRPKSIIQLKTSSTTTSEDRWRRAMTEKESDRNERQNEEGLRFEKDLDKCRYLRGRNSKELSVDEIFR